MMKKQKRIERLLYLFRGERSRREERILGRYIDGAQPGELDEVESTRSAIDELRSHEPILANSEALTDRIMSSVTDAKENEPSWIDRLLDSLAAPRARLAMGLVVVFICGFYLKQESAAQQEWSRMEALVTALESPKEDPALRLWVLSRLNLISAGVPTTKGSLTTIFDRVDAMSNRSLIQWTDNLAGVDLSVIRTIISMNPAVVVYLEKRGVL